MKAAIRSTVGGSQGSEAIKQSEILEIRVAYSRGRIPEITGLLY